MWWCLPVTLIDNHQWYRFLAGRATRRCCCCCTRTHRGSHTFQFPNFVDDIWLIITLIDCIVHIRNQKRTRVCVKQLTDQQLNEWTRSVIYATNFSDKCNSIVPLSPHLFFHQSYSGRIVVATVATGCCCCCRCCCQRRSHPKKWCIDWIICPNTSQACVSCTKYVYI